MRPSPRREQAAAATADLVPRIGRARPLAARSVGHPDAGATSLALLLRAVDPVIRQSCAVQPEHPMDQLEDTPDDQ